MLGIRNRFMISVDGGTNAGNRIPKLLPEWYCLCPARTDATADAFKRLNPGDRYSCPDCGQRRPEAD